MVTTVDKVKKRRKRGSRSNKTKNLATQNGVSDESPKPEEAQMSITEDGLSSTNGKIAVANKVRKAKPGAQVSEQEKAASNSDNKVESIKPAKKRKSGKMASEGSPPKQTKQESEQQSDKVLLDTSVDDKTGHGDKDGESHDTGIAPEAEELLWEINYKELSLSQKAKSKYKSRLKKKKYAAGRRLKKEKQILVDQKIRKKQKKKQKAAEKRQKKWEEENKERNEQKEEQKNEAKDKQVKEEEEEETPKQVFDFDTPEGFLASLIAPITLEKFFSDYWEKKPLFIQRRDSAYAKTYKKLFSRKILEGILNKRNVEFVKDVNVCRFVGEKRESLNMEGRMTVKKLKKLMDKDKATVQFHQPQRFQDELWRINEQLESHFHSLVGANVYMTPQDSQGLAPHYDDVDVFILQLEGEKRWQLHKPPTKLPRDYSKDLDQSTLGKPTHDILLKPGNVLYFPRGTVHYAMTPKDSPSNSTHVTISTYQRSSWGDLLLIALPSILESAVDSSVAFRKGLPPSYLGGNKTDFEAHRPKLTTLIQKLSNHIQSHDEVAANEMMCEFVANRLPPFLQNGTEEETKGPMPTESSNVRLAFPYHTYVTELDGKLDEHLDSDEEPESDDDEENDDDGSDEEEKMEGGKAQMENGKEEEEEEEMEEESDQIYVYHSLQNTREDHMMSTEPNQCSGLKFSKECLATLKQLQDGKDKWISVMDLEGNKEDKLPLLTSLWAEKLLEVQ